jgi:hypothetical protein
MAWSTPIKQKTVWVAARKTGSGEVLYIMKDAAWQTDDHSTPELHNAKTFEAKYLCEQYLRGLRMGNAQGFKPIEVVMPQPGEYFVQKKAKEWVVNWLMRRNEDSTVGDMEMAVEKLIAEIHRMCLENHFIESEKEEPAVKYLEGADIREVARVYKAHLQAKAAEEKKRKELHTMQPENLVIRVGGGLLSKDFVHKVGDPNCKTCPLSYAPIPCTVCDLGLVHFQKEGVISYRDGARARYKAVCDFCGDVNYTDSKVFPKLSPEPPKEEVRKIAARKDRKTKPVREFYDPMRAEWLPLPPSEMRG